MSKTLESGLIVDDQEYYKLLDWKDNNTAKFVQWCIDNANCKGSINTYSKKEYQALLKFAGI